MSGNQDLLQKVVDTTLIGGAGGGLLQPEQADRFLDYMIDQTVLTKECRVVKMNAPTREIDKIDVGARKARKATENVDDHVDADPTFEKISLTTVKIRLDWRLTSESLEDNIEGAALEDHVARLMATQFGNDLEDLFINGDTASTDPLLKALDGWRKRALAGAHVVVAPTPAGGLTQATFNTGLKAMPVKYLQRRGDLKWYAPVGVIQDYLFGLSDRTTALGDAIHFGTPGGSRGGGALALAPFGIPYTEVPLMRQDLQGGYSGYVGNTHGYMELTFPKNRIVGVQREVKVYREFKPKSDAIEYTVFTRVANQIENLDAYVVVTDIKVQ